MAPPRLGEHGHSKRRHAISAPIIISVVDDDQSVRESLPDLVRSFGYEAHAFASAEAFLASSLVQTTQCLVLDVAMPSMSGAELFVELRRQRCNYPVIFITAHSNGDVCASLMAQGAAACLIKPFNPTELMKAIETSLED